MKKPGVFERVYRFFHPYKIVLSEQCEDYLIDADPKTRRSIRRAMRKISRAPWKGYTITDEEAARILLEMENGNSSENPS